MSGAPVMLVTVSGDGFARGLRVAEAHHFIGLDLSEGRPACGVGRHVCVGRRTGPDGWNLGRAQSADGHVHAWKVSERWFEVRLPLRMDA